MDYLKNDKRDEDVGAIKEEYPEYEMKITTEIQNYPKEVE